MNKKWTLLVFIGVLATIVDVLAEPFRVDYYNRYLQDLIDKARQDVGGFITDPITSPRPDAAPKDDDSTNNSGPSDKTTPDKTEKDDLSDDDDDKIDNSTSIQVIVNGKICEIPKGVDTLNLQIIDGHCPDFSNTLNGKPTIHCEKPVTPKNKTTSKAKISGQKSLYPPFSPRLKEIIADIKKSPVLFRLGKKAI